jgi:NAD(P)-binding Rossmann-like domain
MRRLAKIFAVAKFGFQRSRDPIMIDTSNKEVKSHYDYIVVGAGAAGSVLAAELSATGAQVLVIESGGPVGGPLDYHLPIATSPRLNNRKFNMALGHVLVVAPALMPWCGCVVCNGTMTGGRRTGPRVGPSPTCFRSSPTKSIGLHLPQRSGLLLCR